jgi:methionyl aminopeptidase
MRESRRLLTYVEENYKTLPFAERWLYKDFHSKLLLHAALRELVSSGALRQYPILKESGSGLVSQAELTVVVEKDAARVLTK